MSAHDLPDCKRNISQLFASAAFRILLVALQFTFFSASPVVAASVHRAANAAPPEDVARAGVSVVRLLVTYSTLTSPPATIQCTGLGVIVATWASQGATDQNNWVLSDGALVNPEGVATCLSGTAHPKAKLITISIVMSSAYNPQGVVFVLAAPTTASLDVRCAQVGACQTGAALFAFATDQILPFLDPGAATSGNAASSTLGLVKSITSLSVPSPSNTDPKNVSSYANTIPQFLTPVRAATGTSVAVTEAGMPTVDAHGLLVGLQLKSAPLLSSQAILTFMNQQIKVPAQHANPVHDSWNAGITAFYQGESHYTDAKADFRVVLAANAKFLGAQTFLELTTPTATQPSTSKGNTRSQPGEGTVFGIPSFLVMD